MEDQNYENEEDILLEDEDLEAGVKGGSVQGQSGDLDEPDIPLNPEDQDMTYTDADEEYTEYNDEEF